MIKIIPFLPCFLAALIPTAAGAETPRRARAQLNTLISNDDYPADALRKNEQGTVAFRLAVSRDGKPSGCSVVSSSGSSSLDGATCRIMMERARFEPARDAQGNPTTDEISSRITWRLTQDEEPPPRTQTAFLLWSSCALGEASKLALSDLPSEEIIKRSFLPCTALEALVSKETKESAPLEEQRAQIRRWIEMGLLQVRSTFEAPSEAGDPEDRQP